MALYDFYNELSLFTTSTRTITQNTAKKCLAQVNEDQRKIRPTDSENVVMSFDCS